MLPRASLVGVLLIVVVGAVSGRLAPPEPVQRQAQEVFDMDAAMEMSMSMDYDMSMSMN